MRLWVRWRVVSQQSQGLVRLLWDVNSGEYKNWWCRYQTNVSYGLLIKKSHM